MSPNDDRALATDARMYELEQGVEALDLELPGGSVVRIVAGYPGGRPRSEAPFDLVAPVPVFGPVAVAAGPGPVAMFFKTRTRAVSEGPRRNGLAETVLVCNGLFQDAMVGDGLDPVEAPPWGAAVPGVALTAHFPFPLAGRGVDAAIEITLRKADGAPYLMSAEQREVHRGEAAAAFSRFIADNPGLPDALEWGLAVMDSRIMRFEGERLRETAEREASRLDQGAEVLEEVTGIDAQAPSP